jgi:hypothetical protein
MDEVSVYRTIRSVHLCAGLFALVFLIVYAISAVQMTHGKWLRMESHTADQTIALAPGMTDAREAARDMARRYGVSGELTGIRVSAGALAFRVLRPGMVWQADYTSSTGATRLRTTDTGLLGALNRIHQMRGLWHEWNAYNVWAMVLALAGVAILTLGATGVYLWWRTNHDRRLGGAVLGIVIALVGGVAAWMRIG